MKSATYKCVDRMAQDTTESRVPRLDLHTNQILVHNIYSVIAPLILLCLERSTNLYVLFLLISFAVSTNITFLKCFCTLVDSSINHSTAQL